MLYNQFKNLFVIPVLKDMKIYHKNRVSMVCGTVAQESNYKYFAQLGNGPACGLIQMEPNTAKDIRDNWIKYKSKYKTFWDKYINDDLSLEDNLRGNIHFQVFICICHYLRVPAFIPSDLEGQAEYWKKYYNTYLGKGTPEEYINNYNRYCK